MAKQKGGNVSKESASSNDVWEALPGVYEMMRHLIATRHPRLATVDERIAILFKEKASKSGGRVVMGKATKASTQMQTLGKAKYVFIITIPGDVWLEMQDKPREREALLDHCLCACGVTESEEGVDSYRILRPDVQLFSSNIREYGLALARPEDDEEELATATVEEVFGSPKGEASGSVEAAVRSMLDNTSVSMIFTRPEGTEGTEAAEADTPPSA